MRIKKRYIFFLIPAAALIAALLFIFPYYKGEMYLAMFEAVRDNNLPKVKLLYYLGASPDGEFDYAISSFNQPFEFTSHIHNASPEILEFLLKKGGNPNSVLGDGTTPLVCAINEDVPDAVSILLRYGANPHYTDAWTAVDHARSVGHEHLVPRIEPYLKK